MPGRIKVGRSKEARQQKRQSEESELVRLKQRIEEFARSGLIRISAYLKQDLSKEITKFSELPLSKETAQGLKQSHFVTLADIQRKALPLALKGKDVLGAARTGSGKTLAFIIPVLEGLLVRKWNQHDGLGALIISPTRELVCLVLKLESLYGSGSSDIPSSPKVIGGKDLQTERDRLSKMNILVCTPGRMLQHMDQTAGFEANNLQILVLDEADRILDMGFRKTIDGIIENLPPNRQTLLFSATQTKSVGDLARLSLKEPEYVAVHEASQSSTPETLQQHYVVVPLPNKLDTLFAFLKTHLKSKILVRFAYETFKRMHPGIPLLHLHGKQKQTARAEITARFSSSKQVCLFSTDIVARGLDFPAVDWVVQVDAPEDADTYIHRVGRTARYERNGRALLMLSPGEESSFVERLCTKKVPIEKITIKSSKRLSVKEQLQAMCFKDPEIKYLGQKAFVSYIRSIYLKKDRETFNMQDLLLEEYAASLGLAGAPKIKFGSTCQAKALKNNTQTKRLTAAEISSGSDGDDSSTNTPEFEASAQSRRERRTDKAKIRTKYDRMFERRNQDILSEHYGKLIKENKDTIDADVDDDFMAVKRTDHDLVDEIREPSEVQKLVHGMELINQMRKPPSKRKAQQALSKKAIAKNAPKGTRLVFDDEGEAHPIYELQDEQFFLKAGLPERQKLEYLKIQSGDMEEKDLLDKQHSKEKHREKILRRKAREREESSDEGVQPVSNDEDKSPPVLVDEEKTKKRKVNWFDDHHMPKKNKAFQVGDLNSLEDQEALAAYLLRGE
ncbi:ATP-dependent RNA helicase dbp4 [Neolecta irregularis DAH-3]|uniref:ATP-dependent RNA helicase n=1 Tax=Neolecta irregularis (strain DAH-3) TaxID=1198029 RepID=A0A1U7LP02_NEOID|nr:ATP-dependent RNA helicase dbp4 [Neolecta irregularis DAH-3]|eukprot:OLL24358.1 ATP-dependent RNA helicase dbp4 [Neolecta irregularis DAH-3]